MRGEITAVLMQIMIRAVLSKPLWNELNYLSQQAGATSLGSVMDTARRTRLATY